MGLIFLIMMGAMLGWLTTIILRSKNPQALKVNVIAGIGGALLGGLLVNPLIGYGNILSGGYSVAALLVALAGSLILLVSVNLLRRSEMR